jgi:uncharacterized membrane-anchored protein YhcB (DUF1043 family)
MELVVGIITFIIGGVSGFFAHKILSASAQENRKLIEQSGQTEKELSNYKQDVAEHLDKSAQLLEQMDLTCKSAMKQMEQSTRLLKQVTPGEADMPFFSQETQEQLAKTVTLRHDKREKEQAITQAPLDYSGNPSGLFDDKKQSVTNVD